MKIKYVISTLGAVLFVMEFHNNQLDFFNSISKVLFFLILVISSYVVILFLLKYKIFKLNNMTVILSKNTMSTINTIFFTLFFCGTYAFISLKLSSTTKPFSNVNYCSARFSDLEKLNIFIFPFYGFDICEKNAPCDNAFLKGLSNLGVDEIEVIVCDSFSAKNITPFFIDSIIQEKKADLVIWGDYEKPVCEIDTTKIYLNYKIAMEHFSGGPDLIEKDKITSPLLEISSGKVLGNLDELVYWLLTSICYKNGNLQKAVEFVEKINISQTQDKLIIQGLLDTKGLLHVEYGETQKGLDYLLEAFKIDSQSFTTNFNLAITYNYLGKDDIAIQHAKQCESLLIKDSNKLVPKFSTVSVHYELNNLLMILNAKRKNWMEVKRYAINLINIAPNHQRANLYLAASYSDQGIYDLALKYISKSISLSSGKERIRLYEYKADFFKDNKQFDSCYFYYKLMYESGENTKEKTDQIKNRLQIFESYQALTKRSLKELQAIYFSQDLDTVKYTLKSTTLVFVSRYKTLEGDRLYEKLKVK